METQFSTQESVRRRGNPNLLATAQIVELSLRPSLNSNLSQVYVFLIIKIPLEVAFGANEKSDSVDDIWTWLGKQFSQRARSSSLEQFHLDQAF